MSDLDVIKRLEDKIGERIKHISIDEWREVLSYRIPDSSYYVLGKNRLVIGLGLLDLPLTKVPDEVLSLFHLQTLDLSWTSIKELPESIQKLSKLSALILCDTNIKRLPNSISNLNKLQILYLEGSRLTELPDAITEIKSLQSLCLYGNTLSDLPASIAKLENLQVLDLNGNALNVLPEPIRNLTGLRELHLYDNNLTGLPEWLGELANLEMLDLQQNNITDLPESIQNIKTLHLSDKTEIFNLKNQLRIARVQLESKNELIRFQDSTIDRLVAKVGDTINIQGKLGRLIVLVMGQSNGINWGDDVMDVYLVQHLCLINDDEEDVKIIGIYSTEKKAFEAVDRLKIQPGFCDYPDIIDPAKDDNIEGFYIDKCRVDQDDWVEGFVRL